MAFVFVSAEGGEDMLSRLVPVVVRLLAVCEMVGGGLNIADFEGRVRVILRNIHSWYLAAFPEKLGY